MMASFTLNQQSGKQAAAMGKRIGGKNKQVNLEAVYKPGVGKNGPWAGSGL